MVCGSQKKTALEQKCLWSVRQYGVCRNGNDKVWKSAEVRKTTFNAGVAQLVAQLTCNQ